MKVNTLTYTECYYVLYLGFYYRATTELLSSCVASYHPYLQWSITSLCDMKLELSESNPYVVSSCMCL